jgi:hypothetical protein
MRATLDASQVAFNGVAPAFAHDAADHPLHGHLRLRTGAVRHAVHGHGNVANHHGIIECDADVHVVDRFFGGPFALALDQESVWLGVDQFAFDVPQAIFPFEAPEGDLSGVHGAARGGWR